MSKYFTVVFEITDEDKFKLEAQKFTKAMCGHIEFPGAEVTGAGWEDSMTERDNMAAWLDEHGYDSESFGKGIYE
ncbi:hypothetical protein D3C85_1075920 [compost metagenome]